MPSIVALLVNSAFLPTGPNAIEMFAPKVKLPIRKKERRPASSKMKTKSVNSNPTCPPNPAPVNEIADGADQLPSSSRAMTRPDPKRADPRNPALATVHIARP